MGRAIDVLVARGMLDDRQARDLMEAVSKGRPVLVAGGTGAGKTTLMAALMEGYGSRSAHLVEGTPELWATHSRLRDDSGQPLGLVAEQASPASCRPLSPSPLVVGELRDGETATAWLVAAGLGRPCLSSVHSSKQGDAVAKVIAMAVTAGADRGFADRLAVGITVAEVVRKASGERVVTGVTEYR